MDDACRLMARIVRQVPSCSMLPCTQTYTRPPLLSRVWRLRGRACRPGAGVAGGAGRRAPGRGSRPAGMFVGGYSLAGVGEGLSAQLWSWLDSRVNALEESVLAREGDDAESGAAGTSGAARDDAAPTTTQQQTPQRALPPRSPRPPPSPRSPPRGAVPGASPSAFVSIEAPRERWAEQHRASSAQPRGSAAAAAPRVAAPPGYERAPGGALLVDVRTRPGSGAEADTAYEVHSWRCPPEQPLPPCAPRPRSCTQLRRMQRPAACRMPPAAYSPHAPDALSRAPSSAVQGAKPSFCAAWQTSNGSASSSSPRTTVRRRPKRHETHTRLATQRDALRPCACFCFLAPCDT
jgi:hypothetical protein